MPSIDNGAMLAQKRALLHRADKDRANLYDHIGQTVDVLRGAGANNHQIMKAIGPIVEPLRRLTISSGRDDSQITGQIALMFSRPVPKPAPQVAQPARRTVQAAPPAQPDFHLNDVPDANIDAAIDRAFEGMGV
jgi:hypothetical protein